MTTRQSATPAPPAASLESATPDGASQRIALRRSVTLRTAAAVFVLIATLAVYTCLAARMGAWWAVPFTLAACALLILGAARHELARPITLKLGPDGLSAWDGAGNLLAQGRIAGCSQWTGRLLVLALAPDHGRPCTLMVPVDAIPASAFRELAVLGRRGAGA
ncbi:protein YgfX [Paraburkholderia sp. DD10]|uniref:protein YgfX n=1 Tax=Paraburkholderia TaxID=1822464 RepID=UPI00285CBCEA|nr:protein YgfX [Paraburkholderia terricola]MDR6445892.1 hypothetical protein [Paraburkholderia terricola]